MSYYNSNKLKPLVTLFWVVVIILAVALVVFMLKKT